MKLSHSAIGLYMSCPKKYSLHYIERLRDKSTHAALLFGSALDVTLNQILLDLSRGALDPLCQTYDNIFLNNWRNGTINDKSVELMTNENLVYANTDFDAEILEKSDLLSVHYKMNSDYAALGVAKELADILTIFKTLHEKKLEVGYGGMSLVEKQFYNHMNWISSIRKAGLMIRAYVAQIVPKIKKVHSIQKSITLENAEGDSVVGFIDAVLEFHKEGLVLIDHKTSAREYEWDAVLKSTQLALYLHAIKDEFPTQQAGYIVFKKLIQKNRTKKCNKCGYSGETRAKTCDQTIDSKRCHGEWTETIKPEASIQVLINEIPAKLESMVIENFAEVVHVAKLGVFPRNLSSCEKPFLCQFYNKCHSNDTSNLIKLEDKKESK